MARMNFFFGRGGPAYWNETDLILFIKLYKSYSCALVVEIILFAMYIAIQKFEVASLRRIFYQKNRTVILWNITTI